MEWYLLRPFSIYFSWLFIKLGFNANTVSTLGLACGVGGSLLLFAGNISLGLTGAVLIWFGFLLDCVDGEVARYNKKGSVSGTYLDYFVGGVNDMMILIGLSFYLSIINNWDARVVVSISVMLAYLEKIISLYAHSVVYRNIRSCWDSVTDNPDAEKAVWKEMGFLSRLLRVPFETFFRSTIILVAFIITYITSDHIYVTLVWFIIMALGWLLVVKSFISEFFGKRVEKSMTAFIATIKSYKK